MYMFATRPIFQNLNIPSNYMLERFTSFFGNDFIINDRIMADKYLQDKLSTITQILEKYLTSISTLSAFGKISSIICSVNKLYIDDRTQRETLKKIGAQGNELDVFDENKNIAICIFEASNIWIENTVLLNVDSSETRILSEPINKELLLNLYIYGLLSRVKSLISLSKKFRDCKSFKGYTGVDIRTSSNIPIEPIYNHPVIYTNSLVMGNQNMLTHDSEYKNANTSLIGLAFKKMYGIEFLHFCGMLYSISKKYSGHQPFLIPFCEFGSFLQSTVNVPIHMFKFYDFTLSIATLSSALRDGERLIWKCGTNKFRYEIRPFIQYHNNWIIVSPNAAERSFQLWNSLILNGGSPYTDSKDEICQAFEKRNFELSDRLVQKLKSILVTKYPSHFCDIEVHYSKIWDVNKYPIGKYNYGDFDIIFLDKENNELFLIEAKFFSDALHASRIVDDYDKLFLSSGYHYHCRKRYDLVISDPEPMKVFIGRASQKVTVHTLFVSSKSLQVEFQDEDNVVTFLSLENFEKYLDGKLLSEEDESIVVRPSTIL